MRAVKPVAAGVANLGGELLKKWRDGSGLTQQQAGALVGVDLTRISKWERCVLRPGRGAALAIESATGGAVPASAWDRPATEAAA